jgi:hypothetical protein
VTDWSGTEIVYLIDLFFLIDIVLNFFTSYRYKGTEIADRKKVSAHYLKTLFVIDLLANFPLDRLRLVPGGLYQQLSPGLLGGDHGNAGSCCSHALYSLALLDYRYDDHGGIR